MKNKTVRAWAVVSGNGTTIMADHRKDRIDYLRNERTIHGVNGPYTIIPLTGKFTPTKGKPRRKA